jgi:hypothetical protein
VYEVVCVDVVPLAVTVVFLWRVMVCSLQLLDHVSRNLGILAMSSEHLNDLWEAFREEHHEGTVRPFHDLCNLPGCCSSY